MARLGEPICGYTEIGSPSLAILNSPKSVLQWTDFFLQVTMEELWRASCDAVVGFWRNLVGPSAEMEALERRIRELETKVQHLEKNYLWPKLPSNPTFPERLVKNVGPSLC
eukprot:Protomagalhaensia_sp_Gyna_25__1502@NODE_176_length_4608_cov_524_977895_g138_i0_p4_GENE_NODE_176_length_4608_cov_524_977895_g138_i0NODE_176_length_4608_cov_524_977895_g138_i0_p4_ORF_typecomplete_len111_score19_12TSC22/PF01166_18/0_036ABC_tran_CTD/PF16326_5/0_064Trimer_CC/PF08954_11/0_081DUF2730/PF10805_8/0_098Pox_A_type_inc/PF04508_12/0_15Surfac_Dtrimer/PF09006_11/0_15Miff/PF05644_11/0_19bZIP_2/PF07716_15/0_26_NODE_176_length_4608_cov_524_977895_g138_i0406738